MSTSDHHTPGDAGTVAVGLDSGLSPLIVDEGGNVLFSRTVTASRRVRLVADKVIGDCADEIFDLIALPGGISAAYTRNALGSITAVTDLG